MRTPIKIEYFNSLEIIHICCSEVHNIALYKDANAYTFGHNAAGQLGIGKMSKKEGVCKVTIQSNNELLPEIY